MVRFGDGARKLSKVYVVWNWSLDYPDELLMSCPRPLTTAFLCVTAQIPPE